MDPLRAVDEIPFGQASKLIATFPLRPRLNFTGRCRLLFWWDSYWHGKVIIARTQKQLETIWKRRLEEDPDARPLQLWDAVIVTPPLVAQETYALDSYKMEQALFASWVARLAKEYQKLHGKLPRGVKPCTKYDAPDYGPEEENESHYQCRTCHGTALSLPFDALYERFAEEYRTKDRRPDCRARRDPPILLHSPRKPVFVAYNLDSEKPHIPLARWLHYSGTGQFPDFFFQGRKLPLGNLAIWATKALKSAKHEMVARERERDVEMKRHDQEQADLIERMLDEVLKPKAKPRSARSRVTRP